MNLQEPASYTPNIWSDVLGVLDKLSIKDAVTRGFIFRPPSPTYTFASKSPKKEGLTPKFTFKPAEEIDLSEFQEIKVKAYKLYQERKDELHMLPLILIRNSNRTSDYLMIYSHGNSCDLGTIYRNIINLSLTLNIDIIAYDYSGYGISSHKASERNTYRDLETILSFAVGKLNQPLNKIVLCGFSLGSGPTIEMATRFQSLPFMLLFAPLTSCLGVWNEGKGQYGFKHDIYDNIGKMKKVWCDMLIIHGKDDHVVTNKHSQQLMKAYLSSHPGSQNKAFLLQISKADHEDLHFGLEFEDCSYRTSFITYFNRLISKNHTNSMFIGGVNEEKEEPEENQEAENDDENENGYCEIDDIDDDTLKNMCNLLKRTSVDNEPGSTEFESSEWNSSFIVGECSPEEEVRASVAGRLVRFETEHLKDLWSKVSVNKIPDKWEVNEDATYGAEGLLFRKTLL